MKIFWTKKSYREAIEEELEAEKQNKRDEEYAKPKLATRHIFRYERTGYELRLYPDYHPVGDPKFLKWAKKYFTVYMTQLTKDSQLYIKTITKKDGRVIYRAPQESSMSGTGYNTMVFKDVTNFDEQFRANNPEMPESFKKYLIKD